MDEQSTLNETLKRIETVIAGYREDIELGKDLIALKNNPHFQRVIMSGYIDKEAKKLFNILTDPTGATPYTAEQTHLRLEAISHFKSYVGTEDYPGTVMMDAQQAPLKIEKEEAYRKELTAEYANGDVL